VLNRLDLSIENKHKSLKNKERLTLNMD
jgi:hypothetical protein